MRTQSSSVHERQTLGLHVQATLLGHRVAWLEVKQARAEAAAIKKKVEQGQQLLLQRQKELQESQAPVKLGSSPP